MILNLLKRPLQSTSAQRIIARQALEILALRQQLAMYGRAMKKPRPKQRDRLFWVILYRFWPGWRNALAAVSPDTVIRWHRAGFRLFWKWKSRHRRPGRPKISQEIRAIIKAMIETNPLWGAPRIHGELLMLGFDVDERTISRYLRRAKQENPKPSSQTWMTFLRNHMASTAAIDFFVVPTATFRLLYVFIVLSHDRRRIVHFNVTDHPHSQWTRLQILQAFPWNTAPEYLLRDRQGVFDPSFSRLVESLGTEEVLIQARKPWQNPFCERVVGSIRRDCLDHMIILNERHLFAILKEYFAYYHDDRTHQGLDGDTPAGCRGPANLGVSHPIL